jgi:hypothetical protein
MTEHLKGKVLEHSSALVWSATPFAEIRREHHTVIKQLAQEFVNRASALELSAKDRNQFALEFWIGAAVALRLTGQAQLSEDVARVGVLDIGNRGYQAISELALF